jgi:hypothetical protein
MPPAESVITRDHITPDQWAAYERTYRRLLAPVPDDAIEQPEPDSREHDEAAEPAA